ncbi:sugar ABC transporter permease [Halalkalibacterium halodurans]|jgi:arabinosaccharide transport system permease protein|uniref:Arabinose transporter permease n=1 Tax=Halalkalibacterium halodurans TaxID=86665 RepID=A0A0M0KC04_ALKHA|nr:sugar ABC transporter permease [Halalkalibacterium halodurans]MED3648897.1 sugar ABC transporter permease [Halalkalibacterium halodurans]TPE70352.1 sugar ABC transporter permease [Halalkalibacterium halodurans]
MLKTGKGTEQEVVQVHTRKSSRLFTFFNSQKVVPYVLISPFILSFIVLSFYPTVQAIVMSFQRVLPSEVTYVGLWNYSRILNPTFFTALQNTTTYMILTVVILVSIPMLFAVLLNSKVVKFRILFRTALFLPALTSVIVAGMVFRLMFSESDTAVANQILNWIGLESVEWRYNAWSGMFLMVVLASWRWMGINILYFLAALQNVPKELYEAADIDGANVVQKFFYVTLPFLKPVTIFVTTISVIGGFRMFEESFVFWEAGSPGNIGLTIVGYLYQEGIQQNDMGFGAAIGVVLMLIIFVISITQLYLTGAFKKGDQ